jgi:hypothetical protein
MNHQGGICRIDFQACSLCAQWTSADSEMVEEVQASVTNKDNRRSLASRGIAEYYDLLMTNESIEAAFSTREAEKRLISASPTVQSNMTHYKQPNANP